MKVELVQKNSLSPNVSYANRSASVVQRHAVSHLVSLLVYGAPCTHHYTLLDILPYLLHIIILLGYNVLK